MLRSSNLLRTSIKQELNRIIQRITKLFLLFLLKLLQPKNSMHSLPHNPWLASRLCTPRGSVCASDTSSLLRVLQIRPSSTRLSCFNSTLISRILSPHPSTNGLLFRFSASYSFNLSSFIALFKSHFLLQ